MLYMSLRAKRSNLPALGIAFPERWISPLAMTGRARASDNYFSCEHDSSGVAQYTRRCHAAMQFIIIVLFNEINSPPTLMPDSK